MAKKENLTSPLSLRLSPKVRKTVKQLSDDTGLQQAQLFDLLLRASCQAIEDNGGEFQVPLRFALEEKKKV